MNWLQGFTGRGVVVVFCALLGACSSKAPRAPEPVRTVILQAAQLPLPLPRSNFCAGLDSTLRSPVMQGAVTSLVVREAGSGKLVCEYNAQSRLVPASSLKLVTTAAAMDVLGADFRFSTTVLTTGVQQGGLLVGICTCVAAVTRVCARKTTRPWRQTWPARASPVCVSG